jgi:hypothetical protein
MHNYSAKLVRLATRGTADSNERPARQIWAFLLWAGQVLTTLTVLLSACLNIESIVFGFPVLTILGLLLALVSRPIASWSAMLFALSAPVVCAIGALAIAAFEMMPDDAQTPIASMLVLYGMLITPVAVAAALRIRDWKVDATSRSSAFWRYSLKSLLILMTAVCVVATVLSLAFKSTLGFPLAFASFGLVAIGLACVVAARFVSDRRRLRQQT